MMSIHQVECDPKSGRCNAPGLIQVIFQWISDHRDKTEQQDGQISLLFSKIDKILFLGIGILLSMIGGAIGIIAMLWKVSVDLQLMKGGHP
jgi:hypothetical protein